MSDFRIHGIGNPFPLGLGGTSFSSFTMDGTTDQHEIICQVVEPCTITRLGYRLTTLTGVSPTFKISIQGVDASGNPDGTIKGGASPASANFTVSGSNSWVWVTLANSYVAARGEFIAIVISYVSGTIDASNNASFAQTLTNGPVMAFPYAIGNNATVRTRVSPQPVYGYASATKTYGMPVQVIRTTVLSSNTTPDETALRFIFDMPFWKNYQVLGCRFSGVAAAAAKTTKMILYDGTTVLQDMTWDSDVCFAAATQRGWTLYFDEATLAVLNTGQEYRLALQPQDLTNGITWHGLEVPNAADMDAYPGGRDWYMSQRTDAGAWTDVTTVRPLAELIIADVQGAPPQIISAAS